MNNLSAFTATLAASANKSASAGIISDSNPSNDINSNNRKTACTHSDAFDCVHTEDSSENGNQLLMHQIGTNLADLSVCWHKLNISDTCQKCSMPFYEANQFICESCFIKEQTFTKQNAQGTASLFSTKMTPLTENDQQGEDLIDFSTVKNNFEDEFSSLIKNSTFNSTGFFDTFNENKLKMSDQMNLISIAGSSNNSILSKFSTK